MHVVSITRSPATSNPQKYNAIRSPYSVSHQRLHLPRISHLPTVELSDITYSAERPTSYSVPGTGTPSIPRVILALDWHLAKFEQHETMILLLRSLNRIVDQTIRMTAGDEPILNGGAVFRSPSLRLRAQDAVLLGGFTYGVLAASVRGLGELIDRWDATGVDVTVYANGRKVGFMDLDFVI